MSSFDINRKINIFEETAEAAYQNLFIRSLALHHINLLTYREKEEKGIFDTSLLSSAEKHLKNAYAIALKQVELHQQPEFMAWLGSERWMVGSLILLAECWDTVSGHVQADKLRAYHEKLCTHVAELRSQEDTKLTHSSIESQNVAASLFNEMTNAANAYDQARKRGLKLPRSKGQDIKETKLCHNLLGRLRTFIQFLDTNGDVKLLYTRGTTGDTLCTFASYVVERAATSHSVVGIDERQTAVLKVEFADFAVSWNGEWKRKKFGMCGEYVRELNKKIQESITLYIYYDKCSYLERLLIQLRNSCDELMQAAQRSLAKLAEQAVSWEFLRAGLLASFWPLLAPICLVVDAVKGNNKDDSWYHAMNKDITVAWNKSPATLFFITLGIVGTAVFVGLTAAATFGVAPAAFSAALALTHATAAGASIATLLGATFIGGYAWKRNAELQIENEKQEMLKLLDAEREKLEETLEDSKGAAKAMGKMADETAEEADEIAELNAQQAMQRLELQKKMAEKRKNNLKPDGKSGAASSAPVIAEAQKPSEFRFEFDDSLLPESVPPAGQDIDLQAKKAEILKNIDPKEAETGAKELKDIISGLEKDKATLEISLNSTRAAAKDSATYQNLHRETR